MNIILFLISKSKLVKKSISVFFGPNFCDIESDFNKNNRAQFISEIFFNIFIVKECTVYILILDSDSNIFGFYTTKSDIFLEQILHQLSN